MDILALGAQQNAPHSSAGGQTLHFPDMRSGDLPISVWRKGSAVDTTAVNTLRGLALTVTAMDSYEPGPNTTKPRVDEQGRHDSAVLYVAVETGPTNAGPWTVLHQFTPTRQRGVERVARAVHPDAWVRAAWFWMRRGAVHDGIRDDVRFTFGVSADVLPAP